MRSVFFLVTLVAVACSSSAEDELAVDDGGAGLAGQSSGGSAGELSGGTAGALVGGSGGTGAEPIEAGVDATPEASLVDSGPDAVVDAGLEAAAVDAKPDAPPVEAGPAPCPEPCVSSSLLWEAPATTDVNGYFKAFAVCPPGTTLNVNVQEPYCFDCSLPNAQYHVIKKLWQCGATDPVDAGPSPCKIFFRCSAPNWCASTSTTCS